MPALVGGDAVSTERCVLCNGHGEVSANANFLLARLSASADNDYRWIGNSSSAMVVAAITGEEPKDRPYDGWDLGRCMVTRAVAPEHLHAAMDKIIERWTRLIAKDKPYWGEDAARGMVAEHALDVRARIAQFMDEGIGGRLKP